MTGPSKRPAECDHASRRSATEWFTVGALFIIAIVPPARPAGVATVSMGIFHDIHVASVDAAAADARMPDLFPYLKDPRWDQGLRGMAPYGRSLEFIIGVTNRGSQATPSDRCVDVSLRVPNFRVETWSGFLGTPCANTTMSGLTGGCRATSTSEFRCQWAPLGPGESRSTRVSAMPLSRTGSAWWAEADPDGRISESNERNVLVLAMTVY